MFKNLSTRVLEVVGQESEIIELALSYGFRGIELDIQEFATRAQNNGLDRARRLLDSAKLKVGYFPLPLEIEADDETFAQQLTALAPLANVAATIGCTRTITTIAPGSEVRPYHENFEFHRQRLTAIAEILDKQGLTLGVGFVASASLRQDAPFQFIHDLDATLLLLSMLGARNVGVSLDLWDAHVAGVPAVEAVSKACKQGIVNVFVADFPADSSTDDCTPEARLAPGESGVIDLQGALVALAEAGYDGPITPAPHRSRFENATRDAIVRETGQALDKVWKAAGLSPSGKLTAAAKE